jgi:glucose/arabinose dehydrogenase
LLSIVVSRRLRTAFGMGHKSKIIIGLVLFFATWRAHAALPQLDLQLVASGVSNPVGIAHANDGSGRLFIVNQSGVINIFNGTNVLATPFLNISSQTVFSGEEGLLSVAFHPGYATNGQFFVFFTQPGGNNLVARFTASPPSANTVNTNTMVRVLQILHPTNTNHNGGQMQFGPDGYLYISTGDGGSECDPPNNAQNLGLLLGKMLRIDVSNSSTNYMIPPSNPFVGVSGVLPEIWAYGLRNPWRFSFDRVTGDLWIGDVGQDTREEVDFQVAGSAGGQNYGWRYYEGFLTNTCGDATNVPSVLPILDYDHSLSRCAIMGGYRYRGAKIAPLLGMYFYGDYCGGQIYGITNSGAGWTSTLVTNSGLSITTFGEDDAGEIYLSQYTSGSIYRIIAHDSVGDGIADWWRQQYFNSPKTTNSASCAACDPDGDGFSNLQEYLAGTDPTNSLSALSIHSIASVGTNVTVNFASASGHKYFLERTDQLPTGSWTPITTVSGTGGIVPATDIGSAGVTNRFYRVRLAQ